LSFRARSLVHAIILSGVRPLNECSSWRVRRVGFAARAVIHRKFYQDINQSAMSALASSEQAACGKAYRLRGNLASQQACSHCPSTSQQPYLLISFILPFRSLSQGDAKGAEFLAWKFPPSLHRSYAFQHWVCCASYLPYACSLLGLLFVPDDGGDMFLRHVSTFSLGYRAFSLGLSVYLQADKIITLLKRKLNTIFAKMRSVYIPRRKKMTVGQWEKL
jgi:hypothetical protein